MIKVRFAILITIVSIFVHQPVFTQNKDIYLFIDSTTIIGKITENQIFTSPTNIDYTLQGNSIYQGDTISRQQLLFLVNAKDILSKKAGLVYQNDSKTIQYITRNSIFYLGDHPLDEENEDLLSIVIKNDSLYHVFSGIDGNQIGTIEGRFANQVQIVAAAHMYIKHYQLDDQVNVKMSSLTLNNNSGGLAYMRPANEYLPYYEWVWDGKVLKPAWGYRPDDEWSFDGKYIKPLWSADPQTEWIWDGGTLKPFWDAGVEQQWIWKDNMLKPFWDSNPDLQWIFEEPYLRPMWSFDPTKQWVIEGDFPLPLMALIALGKADR